MNNCEHNLPIQECLECQDESGEFPRQRNEEAEKWKKRAEWVASEGARLYNPYEYNPNFELHYDWYYGDAEKILESPTIEGLWELVDVEIKKETYHAD